MIVGLFSLYKLEIMKNTSTSTSLGKSIHQYEEMQQSILSQLLQHGDQKARSLAYDSHFDPLINIFIIAAASKHSKDS